MTSSSKTTPVAPAEQRRALLDSERKANQQQPRNVKEDALTEKVFSVEPDGTGPTPTETFDPEQEQRSQDGKNRP